MAKDDHLDLVGDWDALRPQKPEPAPKPASPARAGVLDVNELRAATERAIQEGAEKKRAAEEARVADILAKTRERARKEAAKGKTSCRVMKLRHDKDYTYIGEGSARTKKIALEGIGKLVHDQLVSAQIRVDFERTGGNYYDEDIWLLMKW